MDDFKGALNRKFCQILRKRTLIKYRIFRQKNQFKSKEENSNRKIINEKVKNYNS